jgi:hypothetical protein
MHIVEIKPQHSVQQVLNVVLIANHQRPPAWAVALELRRDGIKPATDLRSCLTQESSRHTVRVGGLPHDITLL